MNFTLVNITGNTTGEIYGALYTQDEKSLMFAAKLIKNIFIPLICVVGLFGNTMSLLVFSARSMKKSSCSVFLGALAFVDNIFLISLVITWIDGEWFPLLTYDLACASIIFLTYVASFLSVWFIVGFTCERFIAICYPLKSTLICSVFREKIAVLVLAVIACIAYNYSFWTTKVVVWGHRAHCSPRVEYYFFLNLATWVDTIVTMVVPFFIIVFTNSKVLLTVIKCPAKSYRRPIQKKSVNGRETSGRYIEKFKFEKCRCVKTNPQIRVTRTLLLVSTTFLLLNLPAHSIRLYNLITALTTQSTNYTISVKFFFIQELTAVLYYSTFSCNFILYTLFGRNFQNSLRAILQCKATTSTHKEMMLRRLSSTQGSVVTFV